MYCLQPLWRDVLYCHQQRPIHVMLGGGDQIYNDTVWQVRHDTWIMLSTQGHCIPQVIAEGSILLAMPDCYASPIGLLICGLGMDATGSTPSAARS
jgi:hypothetical protein